MEVNNKKGNFKTGFECLIQQVEEQSELCDLTIKHGIWKKNFHRCVLASSPFFENVIRGKSNFIEGNSGIVELKIETTPKEVEMALMFLYGVHPVLTFDNIGGILELAEFFMIEDLKAYCISWLRSEVITEYNCMFVLQLSTKYGFILKPCIKYIESHLHKVFHSEDAMNLSRDSLEYFFSDNKFSYVSMDEKLIFLAKWIKENRNEPKENVMNLISKIDQHELSCQVMEIVQNLSPLNEIIKLKSVISDENKRHDVLITSSEDHFLCLDIYKNRWYRLNSNMSHLELTGVRNAFSEVYSYVFPSSLVNINLETNDIIIRDLNIVEGDINEVRLYNVRFRNDTIIGMSRKLDETEIQAYARRLADIGVNLPITYNIDEPFRGTEVYIGYVSTQQEVELFSVFTLRNINIIDLCLSSNRVAAFLTESKKKVILFDIDYFKIEVVEIKPAENYMLSESGTGFLIYNNQRCYCVSRLSGPALSKKYFVEEFTLEKMSDYVTRYHHNNGFWFRFSKNSNADDVLLQYATHKELTLNQFRNNIKWVSLSIPDDVSSLQNLIDKRDLFVVQLPANKLRCPISCPHCNFAFRNQMQTLFSDVSDSSEDVDEELDNFQTHNNIDSL